MLKIILKTALITALAIVVYETANQLLIYKYIRFDYYASAIAVVALLTGILLARKSNGKASRETADVCAALTNKEMHILLLISEGKTNKEIAALNFVELSTIKTHINNLYGKLGVNNRKQAVAVYHQYAESDKSTLSPPVII